MKSLRYRISEKPVNLDDCIDRARSNGSSTVWVHLDRDVQMGDANIVTQWLAHFLWRFGDTEVPFTRVCGTHFLSSGDPAEQEALQEANNELAQLIKRIRATGARVKMEEAHDRFRQ